MANYKEIVTKAVISKGKKLFTTTNTTEVENPSTILGCWVINHDFHGIKKDKDIIINGSYDVNIWYSFDNDTKTNVVKVTDNYHEVVHMKNYEENGEEEVIVKCLKQPSCIKTGVEGNTITYTIEKEMGIELVGDIKVKIEANMEEDPWDEIGEDNNSEINEDFIKEKVI